MKREKTKDRDLKKIKWYEELHPGTKKVVLVVISFIIATVLALSYTGKGGLAGNYIFKSLNWLLGSGYFFAPLTFILIGFSFIFSQQNKFFKNTILGGVLFLVTSLTALEVFFGEGSGGTIGAIFGRSLIKLFDFWASAVISVGLIAISLLITLNLPLFEKKSDEKEDKKIKTKSEELEHLKTFADKMVSGIKEAFSKKESEFSATIQHGSEERTYPTPAPPPIEEREQRIITEELNLNKIGTRADKYQKPPLDLLRKDSGKPSSGDIRANSNVIKRTLENFGINVEMGEVMVGPTVTQYTLRPAEGVKLAKITALHRDLSLSLAAHPIRIEAPIPGKSLVGIEIPNRSIALVRLRSLLEHKFFQNSANPLLFALGRDVAGAPIFADLAAMPHLLVGGATGSGKSVCIHSIITSFIYRNSPESLRFIMVDPKRVELTQYNDIPHLLIPVITDPKKAVQAFRWATREMDRRYDMLSEVGLRDIASFNKKQAAARGETLPYLVIIVDELADLMATFPREVESSIIRIAQMARAVGIHLILSTQRPSVEVITGLIKANITSRIAFQVASQIDSRTILDMAGAERLLGNGDMLFLAGDVTHPRRIQGAFISEDEVRRVVDFIKKKGESPEYEESIFEEGTEKNGYLQGETEDDEDPLYEEAKNLVIKAGKASASYLQRRLKIGYARAARLLDIMEERGVVGPADGSKPREILIKNENNPKVLK